MSIESTDSTAAITRHDSPTSQPQAETVCDGCRELTARVERLEQQLLAQPSGTTALPKLGTTSCYWICIAAHAFCIFCFNSSMILMQLGLMITIGACGTVIAIHVFSTRPILEKVLRTVLSCSVVGISAFAAFVIQDSDVLAMAAMVLTYLPIVFLGGWLVAKMFVWTRGWKIVPPDGSNEYPKLQIRHLMSATFLVAAYLSFTRILAGDGSQEFVSEMLATVLYVLIPIAITTFCSCLLARFILSNQQPSAAKYIAFFVGTAFTLTFVAFIALAVLSGETSLDVDTLVIMAIYAVIAALAAFASPAFTFVMLRRANYRLIHP